MNNTPDPDYTALINSIRIKRLFTLIAYIAVMVFIIIFFTETYDNFLLALVLIGITFFAYILVFSLVSLPIYNSMEAECEPYKHLILNQTFNKKNKGLLSSACALDFFYLGNYMEAISHANSLMALGKPAFVTTGLLHRAKCEFMLGYYDALKVTAAQFDQSLTLLTKQKERDAAIKMRTVIALMYALTGDDPALIERCNLELTEYSQAKHTLGFNHYLHGLAARKLSREQECSYHLMSVKEICKSTVLPQYCDELLRDGTSKDTQSL